MKSVLGLPGRNPETERWMSALLSAAGYGDSETARYRHWQESADPDVMREANEHPVSGRQLVVAKSMGTMVLLAAAGKGDPQSAVLIGTPIEAYSDEQTTALRALVARMPCLFIQQTEDFTGSAMTLRAAIGDRATLREVPGSDHVYADVEVLAALIREWQEALDG